MLIALGQDHHPGAVGQHNASGHQHPSQSSCLPYPGMIHSHEDHCQEVVIKINYLNGFNCRENGPDEAWVSDENLLIDLNDEQLVLSMWKFLFVYDLQWNVCPAFVHSTSYPTVFSNGTRNTLTSHIRTTSSFIPRDMKSTYLNLHTSHKKYSCKAVRLRWEAQRRSPDWRTDMTRTNRLVVLIKNIYKYKYLAELSK